MIFSGTPNVFCDWLSVTYSPDDSPVIDVQRFIQDVGGWAQQARKCTYQYGAPGTTKNREVKWLGITERGRFVKIEITGQGAAFLRSHGYFGEYLSLLGSSPHTITRLDAAHDFDMDYPIALDQYFTLYPDWTLPLSRKGYPVEKRYEAKRPDGKLSSTLYVGRRGRTKYYLRMYDKAFERMCKGQVRVEEPLTPQTRLELECAKEVGCSLKDAFNPAPLFYHILGGLFFRQVPDEVADWDADSSFQWSSPPRPKDHPAVRMKKLADESPDLRQLLALAQEFPDGRAWLENLLSSFVESGFRSTSSQTAFSETRPYHHDDRAVLS